MAVEDRSVMAWQGEVWFCSRGVVRRVMVWSGEAVTVRQGKSSQGTARRGG